MKVTDLEKEWDLEQNGVPFDSDSVNGKGYQQAHIIAEKADIEIRSIMGSVYEILFNSKIQDSLKDLLSLMHHDESGYRSIKTLLILQRLAKTCRIAYRNKQICGSKRLNSIDLLKVL